MKKRLFLLVLMSLALVFSFGCNSKEKTTEITIGDYITMEVPGEWHIDAEKSNLGAHEVYRTESGFLEVYITLPEQSGINEAKRRAEDWSDSNRLREYKDVKDYAYTYYSYVNDGKYNVFIGVAEGEYFYSIAGTINAETDTEVVDFLTETVKSIK